VTVQEARLLFFRSAGERFSLDVDYVQEIVPQQEVTPVPFVPAAVAGIINHRGAIFTLISFARLAGLGEDDGGTVVLLRLPDMAVGLAVEAVEGIERIGGGLVPVTTEAAQPPTARFLHRARDASGRMVHAIDAERLVETIGRIQEEPRAAERMSGAGHG
jgi:purine-binding chemotaxis protein CheW